MDINNHIHTVYSFSPYTPSEAVLRSREAGLCTCGLMDHDTMAGAYEFLKEAKKIDMPVTCGMEVRVKMDGGFANKRLNNPDQNGIAYVALHGVPRQNIDYVTEYLSKYREKRNERNEKMCDKLNALTGIYGINLSFENDVMPLSEYLRGGVVTERHICYAFGKKLIARYGRNKNLINFLKKLIGEVPEKIENYLLDETNPHYEYDLLGLLKSSLSGKYYILADEECMTLQEFISFGKSVGAIVTYAYLGDIEESVTGDKKAQKFEDDFLEELLEYLSDEGINAITYMPSRNNVFQLKRLRELSREYGFMEICGEDINSSRQAFVCNELQKNENKHLIDATFALIGHELKSEEGIENGMFSEKTIAEMPSLEERIKYFMQFGLPKA